MNLDELRSKEEQAKICTLAMMSYNASIARVLEKGGVKKFKEIAWRNYKEIIKIQRTKEQFDNFHSRFVEEIINKIRTNKGNRLVYGQAQKPVNVVLKVLVDWANLPDKDTAEQLREFLHVPLDRILMKEFKKEYPEKFEKKIKPEYSNARIPSSPNKYHSLRYVINKDIYWAWQTTFREVHPEKPVLLDVAWFLNRETGK